MSRKSLLSAARELVSLHRRDRRRPEDVSWNVSVGEAEARLRSALSHNSPDGVFGISTTEDGHVVLSIGVHGERPSVEITVTPEKAVEICHAIVDRAQPLLERKGRT